jgi:hypothetical protein
LIAYNPLMALALVLSHNFLCTTHIITFRGIIASKAICKEQKPMNWYSYRGKKVSFTKNLGKMRP